MPMDNPIIEGAFDRLYEEPGALTSAYMEGRAARKKLIADLKADMTAADNGAPPPDRLSQAASQLGRLIQHDPSVRLVFAGFGGWDTHVNQGAVSGQLTNHLKALGDGLATFINQLGSAYGETVILVISEFGRTVHENGNGGTDHGHGNVMWVMGGPVRGGRIYGQWPGLSRAGLYQERDLAITTDFREPIVRVLEGHLGFSSSDTARVFPNCPSDSGSVRALIRV
jgi:uncharacterized protein (DUF1501 family)